ncbi:MAG: GNAT family N-acetyltransferase [Anaerolineaceae bacterium]|nr:GNAT family N-acetyltransferase [Anaerolineaceae bacterium]
MKITAHNKPELFQQLQPEWNELLARSQSNRVFSTWEWQSTWWAAYHPGELWVITCRDDSDRLIGIAPWFIDSTNEYGRVVRPIGCVEVTDYLDIIADKDSTHLVFEALADFAKVNSELYDLINLCNLPESSPTYSQLTPILNRWGFDASLTQQEVCPVIVLPTEWESYFDLLDKKQRHELRRKLRRAEGAAESIDWYIVSDQHNLDEEIDRFLHLMGASQYEKAKFLEDPQNLAFFKAIVPITFEKHWLQLSFLMINGEAAAAYLNFVYGDSVLVYNSGLMVDKYGHLSAGIILLAHNIRTAIENGYKVFDFLRGNEIYKFRMGGQETRVFMLTAHLPAS